MAGKTLDVRAPISFDALKAKVDEKYASVLFDHPEGYGTVEVSRLKRREREAIQASSRRADGMIDVTMQNRLAVAYGLVRPWLVDEPDEKKRQEKTIEALLAFPDDFIEPIADKIWEISNDYRNREVENAKGGNEPDPFTRRSSAGTASPSPTDGPSGRSTP